MPELTYTIRKSKRAKQGKIVVTPKGVEVIIPWRVPKYLVPSMLKGKEEWIAERIASMEKCTSDFKICWPENFKDDEEISCRGSIISVLEIPEKYRSNTQAIKWLKEETRTDAAETIAKYESFLSVKPNRLAIKSQKNLWGSCSSKRNININWLLIFAPPEILKYVVWHELCHLEHMNHSSKFWALVESQMPDYKEHKIWLKNYGPILKDFANSL